QMVMLAITTDGDRKIIGVNQVFTSRFQKTFMRAWCGLQQLDLANQKMFKAAMSGKFYEYATQTIASSKVDTTYGHHGAASARHSLVTNFGSSTTFITEQIAEFTGMSADIQQRFDLVGLATSTKLACKFAVPKLKNQFFGARACERNQPLEGELPPALPCVLIRINCRTLSEIINNHRDRIKQSWSDTDIDAIELESAHLCVSYELQEPFRQSVKVGIADSKSVLTFEESWQCIDESYPKLRLFASGLATTMLQCWVLLQWKVNFHF
ncbi:hypothetical protein GN958_ATG05453, partial [Phytophthora infestans]